LEITFIFVPESFKIEILFVSLSWIIYELFWWIILNIYVLSYLSVIVICSEPDEENPLFNWKVKSEINAKSTWCNKFLFW